MRRPLLALAVSAALVGGPCEIIQRRVHQCIGCNEDCQSCVELLTDIGIANNWTQRDKKLCPKLDRQFVRLTQFFWPRASK